MATPVVAALDIGGTKIAAGLVDRSGTVLVRARTSTPAEQGPDAVLLAATGLLSSLVEGGSARPVALGVGSAGVIDPVAGVVTGATDALTGWTGTDIGGAMASTFGWPTVVRNDVHAHALGEATYGAGAAYGSVLLVTVGTGIGGGFVVAGLPGGLLLGANSAAGHVGHIPSPLAAGMACSCGATGHVEAVASGPALVRVMRRAGRDVANLREVARQATSGDAVAAEVVDLGGRALGTAIGGLVNVLDPGVVVVGGGVTNLGEPWWSALRRAAADEALPSLRATPVVSSTLGDDAALVGAAILAWELAEQNTPELVR